MSRNEIIEDLLQKASVIDSFIWSNLMREYDISRQESRAIRELLEIHHDLITTIGRDGTIYSITARGIEVIEKGGWSWYLHQLENEEKERARQQELEAEKLRWETKLAKWQVKVFWPVFLLGLVGGISGIISLGMQVFVKEKNVEDTEQTRLPEYERDGNTKNLIDSVRTIQEINDSNTKKR